LPRRTAGRKVGSDEVDRASEQDLEAGLAGAARDLRRQPCLADAGLPGDERRRAAAGVRRVKRAPELLELACASDERRARAGLHAASIPP
jgi:hypothetical protein